MISLTRLSGTTFLLNADLVERVDCTPDTVVTLVDGTKYLVSESLDEVLAAVVDYRAAIVARAALPDAAMLPPVRGGVRSPRLSAVPLPGSGGTDRPRDRHQGGQS
ncbi:flagellar FlbD family protein [Nocardioides sp. Root190]|uniref:flagellar FlbD family protein n=1 Tax=Nocardioides sp. Root190 TaxID=1736488 RepID=UPI0009E8EB24|nr:flagellar FlbD family protein [Nocardioides sp. Root190]